MVNEIDSVQYENAEIERETEKQADRHTDR